MNVAYLVYIVTIPVMSQLDAQSTTEAIAKLTSLGFTITEPKRYTYTEINDIENKQGMYLLANGSTYYYQDNKLHRNDGPVIESANGDKWYYLNGKRHRTDGPAIEWVNGYKAYYLNGKLHRTDGPAIEYANGNKEYYLDGKLHRTDGPAVERSNGSKGYYLDDKQLSEQEYIATRTVNNVEPVINQATTDDVINIDAADKRTITIMYRNKIVAVVDIDA